MEQLRVAALSLSLALATARRVYVRTEKGEILEAWKAWIVMRIVNIAVFRCTIVSSDSEYWWAIFIVAMPTTNTCLLDARVGVGVRLLLLLRELL